MKHKYKYNLIRENFVYTTQELAELLKVHVGSIQRLINKENMPVIDKNQKPYLLKGREVKEFLKNRAKKGKIKLQYFEFICLKCRKAVLSIPEKIDFEILEINLGKNAKKAFVRGICSNCGCKLNKLSSDKKLESIIDFYT